MTEAQISRDAVEAGARALVRFAYAGDDSQWDKLLPTQQHVVRERAMAMLTAAAPLIVAAERASQTRQIEDLRGVVSGLQVQVGALQALNAGPTEDAQAEATAIIYGWGPRFHAVLSWELEFDADAQIALEAWEQLVLQMCTARAEQLRAQS